MDKPLKGFITYAHKNTTAKDELIMRLDVMQQQNKLVTWHDAEMIGGDKWREEIFKHLADSDILLYLVSAASLASKNCNKELAEAVSSDIRIIPIILEHCDWKHHQLSEFQAFPDKGKPISEWQLEDKAWQDVVNGIRKTVDKMQAQVDSSSKTSEKELRAELAFQQGSVFIMIGQMNKAIEAYSRAIELYPNNPATYNNRGVAYYIKGDYDRVIVDYTKVIELKPDDAKAYYNRGKIYQEKDDLDLAIADFNTVVQLKSDYTEAYIDRGIACYDKGEYDLAIEDYTKAIHLNPNHPNAYNNRGNAYIGKGEYDLAIKNFDKAIDLEPNNTMFYNNRGGAYGKKGDFDRAIEDFNKVIEFRSDHADAYNNRGMAYHKQDKVDRAIADYTKAIDLNPNYANAYNNRGLAYDNKSYFDRALTDFNTSIRLNSRDADVYYNRGVTYGKKNEINRAIANYIKAIDLNPNYVLAYNNRGVAHHNKGDIDRAVADYTKAIDLNPNYAEAYYNRGNAYRENNDFNRAIVDYTKAIDLNPNYVLAYNNRGGVYGITANYDRAIEDFTKVIEQNPDYAEAYYNRGITYGNQGGLDRAIEDFTKAIEQNPDYAEAYNNRGITNAQRGDINRAIADYTKAIDLNPNYAMAYYNRGWVWLHLTEWKEAKSDLMSARDKGMDIIAAFHNDYESVEVYERRNRVTLPDDIAAMLTQRRRSRFPKTQNFLRPDGTPFESPDVLNLLAKLRNAGTLLSQYVQTRPTFGLKTGRQDAFVVDSATRDQLIAEHPSSSDILKPFLHGRDIRRWQVARPDSWLIFTCRGIEINRYPAIRKHLEKYRSSLSKRAGKQKWYELPVAKSGAEHFAQTKLVCPNSYDHQTFAVDTDGFYCGDTCYLIPTEETWLCGLLNSRAVEWFYSQASNQLTGDYLRARSRYMQEIPIPDLTSTQKAVIGKIVDYLIFLQGQPTTSSGDLAHARDAVMLRYFERIIDGLVYESYLREELHHGDKQFFKPLLDERLPQIEEIRGDKMFALQEIFERLYERTHPIRRNLFFLDSVKPIRIIEGKA